MCSKNCGVYCNLTHVLRRPIRIRISHSMSIPVRILGMTDCVSGAFTGYLVLSESR